MVSASVAFYRAKLDSVFYDDAWVHFFVAVFAEDCVFEYVHGVYTGCVYYLKIVVIGKNYKWKRFYEFMKKIGEIWTEFCAFMKKDSWPSFVVTLVLAFIIIKFVFFPALSLVTGTSLPLVIVESCSMYHAEDGFDYIFENSDYEEHGLTLIDARGWIFQNGFTKGDVIFVVGVSEPEIGDVIIFNGGQNHPIIHRVVSVDGDTYTTKGDNNPESHYFDRDIENDAIIGKALFKVPAVGWAKLIFFERGLPVGKKGLCE